MGGGECFSTDEEAYGLPRACCVWRSGRDLEPRAFMPGMKASQAATQRSEPPGIARGARITNQLLVGDVADKLLTAVVVRLVLPMVVLQRLITRVVLKVEIAAGEAGEAGEGG